MKSNSPYYIIFASVIFILYGPSIFYDYVLDDNLVYTLNSYVQKGLGGIVDIFTNGYVTGFTGEADQSYRPFVLLSFAIEQSIFGNNPLSGHLINIILYVICTFLLMRLYQLLFPKWDTLVLCFLVLVFIAHPIHTEVVANIKSRDEILHFLFSNGALYFIIKHLKGEHQKYLWYALASYFLALMSKELAVTYLAVIPMTAYFFTKTDKKQIAKVTAYFLAVFSIYFCIRYLVLETVTTDTQMGIVNNALLAAPNEWVRLVSCLHILVKYIFLLFIPHSLSWDYSFNQIPLLDFGDFNTWLSTLTVLALISFAIKGIKKRSPLTWSILFFFLTISIVSNIFVIIGSTMGERFLFTPSIIVPVILALGIKAILKISGGLKTIKAKYLNVSILGLIFILYSFKTISRIQVWESNESLFKSGIKTAPNSTRTWMAIASLHRILAEQSTDQESALSNYQKAISDYKKSVEILPENFESWYNLGICYNRISKIEEAKYAYQKAIEYNDQSEMAWNNLGTVLFGEQSYETARTYFLKAIEINPSNFDATKNMGASYYNEGSYEQAAVWFEKAYRINSQNQQLLDLLIRTYHRLGNDTKVKAFENTLKRTIQ